MDIIEESLIHFKDHQAQAQIESNSSALAWLIYASFSGFLGVLSCVLTTYWGPGAAGSGVAEVIGYLNGVNYPETISVQTLITKIFGVVLGIAGSLTVGKEGPLAHIGANIGCMVAYMGGQHFHFLQNDYMRRHLIAAGSSAGVSIAFGAPIGGALFMFELTRMNPFWTFSLIWKTFLTACSGVFSLAVLESMLHGKLSTFSSATLKFGTMKKMTVTPVDVIPGAIVLGILSGLLGAFFIGTNFKVNAWRAKYLTKKWHKPIDTFVFSFACSSMFFGCSYFFQSCIPREIKLAHETINLNLKTEDVLVDEGESTVFQAFCRDPETFNPLASLFWNTEGGIVRDIMSEGILCSVSQMLVFAFAWYFFTITTYGVNVPAGLFLPGMIIGCSLGEIYAHVCYNWGLLTEDHYERYRVVYIILGMGGMLAGYTRMKYSLAIIVMETSQNIDVFIPVVLVIGVANFVGSFLTRGLYDRAVRGKQMPILVRQVPAQNRHIKAETIMARDVVTIRCVATLKNIYKCIRTPHNGFPVLNMQGQVIGLISKTYLIILLQKKAYYDTGLIQNYIVSKG